MCLGERHHRAARWHAVPRPELEARSDAFGAEGPVESPRHVGTWLKALVFDWEVPVFDWKVPVFDAFRAPGCFWGRRSRRVSAPRWQLVNWKVPVFGWKVPVFDWKVPMLCELMVESARTVMLRTGPGGRAGAARGVQPAGAALQAAQGRAMPSSRLRWAIGRCPHRRLAPLSTSWRASGVVV